MATLNSIFDIVRIFSERKNNEMFKHLNLVGVNKVVVPIEGARGRGVMTLILLYFDIFCLLPDAIFIGVQWI